MLRAAALAALLAHPVATGATAAEVILSAAFADPVSRYGHDALGPGHEWGAMDLTLGPDPAGLRAPCADCDAGLAKVRIVLPETMVFEDTTPRLADLNGDGQPEVIVVQSDLRLGAQLAVYGPEGLLAATAAIGQRNRWLAPVGAADFDGDGQAEVAYVQTPHLDPVLKIVALRGKRLKLLASAPGLPNHHLGSGEIESAILPCGTHAVILTANAGWTEVMATRMSGGTLTSTPLRRYAGPESFANLPVCN